MVNVVYEGITKLIVKYDVIGTTEGLWTKYTNLFKNKQTNKNHKHKLKRQQISPPHSTLLFSLMASQSRAKAGQIAAKQGQDVSLSSLGPLENVNVNCCMRTGDYGHRHKQQLHFLLGTKLDLIITEKTWASDSSCRCDSKLWPCMHRGRTLDTAEYVGAFAHPVEKDEDCHGPSFTQWERSLP